MGKVRPVIHVRYCRPNIRDLSPYTDESSMSHVDLGRADNEIGRNLYGEILVGRLAGLVVLGVEFAIVENGSHNLIGLVAGAGSA